MKRTANGWGRPVKPRSPVGVAYYVKDWLWRGKLKMINHRHAASGKAEPVHVRQSMDDLSTPFGVSHYQKKIVFLGHESVRPLNRGPVLMLTKTIL